MELPHIVEEIQLVVAPAVMISSSALLLLGFQAKFSNLASRFRSLNHELRELRKVDRKESWQSERQQSLTEQVAHLYSRVTHVKNAIILAYAAILSFILTSVLIFLNMKGAFTHTSLTLATFLLGLVLEFGSVLTLMVEVALAFKVLKIEARSN